MVYWNDPVQKESGQLCQRKGYDHEDKTQDYGNGFRNYGNWFSYDEGCACWEDLSGCSVGISCFLLFYEDQNDSGRASAVKAERTK